MGLLFDRSDCCDANDFILRIIVVCKQAIRCLQRSESLAVQKHTQINEMPSQVVHGACLSLGASDQW